MTEIKEEFLAFQEKRLTPMRRAIAKGMKQSAAEIPQLTNFTTFDATNLLALRKKFKESGEEALRTVTVTDIILYGVAKLLQRYPALNAHFVEDKLRCFGTVNLGCAVDTPAGLLVPVIYDAAGKDLRQLSAEMKELTGAIRGGRIGMDYLASGSFTVSNLGSMGVEVFTPMINPPQTGILGVCCVVNRLKADGTVYPAMGLALTYDHRVIDGAPAGRFLGELCRWLEGPFDLEEMLKA